MDRLTALRRGGRPFDAIGQPTGWSFVGQKESVRMHQTLFIIPHRLLGAPLFYGWLIVGGLFLAVMIARDGWGKALAGFGPIYLIAALIIRFVVPQVEIEGINLADPDGPLVPWGLAIRGYGIFLTLGILAGMALCLIRARQIGVDPERIISLCFWLIVFGIIGARLFFVIQKWKMYDSSSLSQLIPRLLDMTEGGLVVFGGLFGAIVAWALFCWLHKLSFWIVGDIITPGLAIGLAFGRIGCLMNGCCFGGDCDWPWAGIEFPAGSPPYLRQVEDGQMLGIQFAGSRRNDTWPKVIQGIEPGSLAAATELAVGDQVRVIGFPEDQWFRAIIDSGMQVNTPTRSNVVIDRVGQAPVLIPIAALPRRAAPIYPTQIFSSFNALLLCALLWFYYPFRRRDGELFALLIILYPISRFLLEMIRADEPGQFGTPFSISQLVSMVVLPIGILLWIYFRTAGSAISARPATAKIK